MSSNSTALIETGTIYIQRVIEPTTCTVTGKTIAAGDSALFIKPSNDADTGGLVISIEGLSATEHWLHGLPSGRDTLSAHDGGPAAEYGSYAYFKHTCIVCEEEYDGGQALVFGRGTGAAWCHDRCHGAVTTAVERVWNHTDRFLTEEL